MFAGSIPPAIDATVRKCGRFYFRTPWRDVVLTALRVRWYGLPQAPNMPATDKGTAHTSARASITRTARWSTLATFRNIPARTMARPLVASAATFRNNQRPYHEKAHDRRLRYILKCLHLRANSRRCKPLVRVCNIQRGARLERQTYQGSRRLAALRSSYHKQSPIKRRANHWQGFASLTTARGYCFKPPDAAKVKNYARIKVKNYARIKVKNWRVRVRVKNWRQNRAAKYHLLSGRECSDWEPSESPI